MDLWASFKSYKNDFCSPQVLRCLAMLVSKSQEVKLVESNRYNSVRFANPPNLFTRKNTAYKMSAKEEFTCSSKPALDSGALYHTNHLPWAMAMLLAEIDLLFISHNRLGLYKWDGLSLDALDNDSIQQVSILQGHLIISQFLVGERHEKAEGWSLVFRSCPTYLQSQGTAQMAYQQKCYEQCQLKDTPQCTCASLQPYDCGSAVPPIWSRRKVESVH